MPGRVAIRKGSATAPRCGQANHRASGRARDRRSTSPRRQTTAEGRGATGGSQSSRWLISIPHGKTLYLVDICVDRTGKELIMAIARTSIFCGNFIWIVMVALLFSQTSMVNADDPQSIAWREAFVTIDVELREIKGYTGHTVGLMHQRGFAFYEDGQVATVKAWITFERSGAETSYRGYAVYAFPDGASKVGRFTGTGDPRGEQSGQFTLDSGTGRYGGISGQGRFFGHGFPPHGDIYLDVVGTYSIE